MVVAEERVTGIRGRITRRVPWTAALWLLVAASAAWAAMRMLGLDHLVFLAVPLVAFTPYVAAASPVPIALAAATRRWWPAAAGVVVSLALGLCVLPRAFADASPGPAKTGGP